MMSQKIAIMSRAGVPFRVHSVPKLALNVPKTLLDDLAGLAMVTPVDQIWSARMVGDELTEAVRLCNRIAGGVLPSERTGFWPATMVEWGDLMAMIETNEKPSDDEPKRYTPTARQVSRMEKAIGWPGRYLPGKDADHMRRVLALWLRARSSRGGSFSEYLKRKGVARTTAYRLRDRALLIIAIGLTRDGVKP
jgi:hypothetical protein